MPGRSREDTLSSTAVSQRLRKLLVVSVIGTIVLGLWWWLRSSLGIEFNPESIRQYFADLGPIAPFAVYLLVSFRTLLGLPSQLVLVAAGLCFGTASIRFCSR